MRLLLTSAATAGLLLASACSEKAADEPAESARVTTADIAAPPPAIVAKREADAAAAAAGSAAPGLPDAAPGVAFAYRYAFSLPGKAISDVQQRHAAACEELGPEKCQVTGMDFRQADGGAVTARLDLMVAPGIAHRFGKQAIELVKSADGELANADVTGDNAGGQIEASQLRSTGLQGELSRIEKRLATAGLSPEEKSVLTLRADELRRQLTAEEGDRAANERRLASTPMNFTYASKGLFATSDDPLGTAAESSWSSMSAMLGVVMTLIGVALPWLLVVGLLALAWRGFRRRQPEVESPAVTEPPAS